MPETHASQASPAGEPKKKTFVLAKYNSTLSLRLREVYPDWFVQDNDIGYHSKDHGGIAKRRQRHNAVFTCALSYIISHMILNDTHYCSPYPGKHFFKLMVTSKSPQEVSYILKHKPKAYRFHDLVRSGGAIYELRMFMPWQPEGERVRHVRIGQTHWRALQELQNNGKKYTCVKIVESINERLEHKQVMDHVCAKFPTVDRKKLHRTVRYGMSRIGLFNMQGYGVKLFNSNEKFLFHTYKYRLDNTREQRKIKWADFRTYYDRKKGEVSPREKLIKKLTWERTKTPSKRAPK